MDRITEALANKAVEYYKCTGVLQKCQSQNEETNQDTTW